MSLLVLSASDVAKVTNRLSPDELMRLMAQVFSRLSSGSEDPAQSGIYQPHRITVPTTNHSCLFMPSRMTSVGTAMKVVSVPTGAASQAIKERGLPASTLVLDEETGNVKAIVNARRLTALRNAAGSLLATRLLLPPASSPMSILAIGAGAQIFAHLSLFLSSYPSIGKCNVFNRSQNARLASLVSSLKNSFPKVQFEVGLLPSATQHADFRKAVEGANIIITATSSTTAHFPSVYVTPGTHLCLIGSYTPTMHEIDSDLVKRAGKVVVDYKEACLQEAGELISAQCTPSDLVELGDLFTYSEQTNVWSTRDNLAGEIRASGDVTIFKSVGVGVQDVAIACAVVKRAEEENIGVLVQEYDKDD
ncbi:Ketimine reductase mu-crystallin [Grifola frondosa]|uniref:Ketimine reductase mu-crystallin n=1 Tax=Grifola frondosa TaxID=5627 RepID=A0A1C7M8L4_GRIFR|nr:Ketimine reductase mu-crystallin [Grifola frondosa]